MKALVLAAGRGTRLLPLTARRPKPMLPVARRPILEHTIDLLRVHGVRHIGVNLHYRPDAIVNYFGNGRDFGVELTYSHEKTLMGTAGAAKQLEGFLDEPFFVLYGDVLTDLDLTRLAEWHRACGAAVSMALYQVEDPTRAGIVDVDASGHVLRFIEKPEPEDVFSDLANAGIMVVEPWVLRYVPLGSPYDFGMDLLPDLVARGIPVYGQVTTDYVLDIGSPERYWQAQVDAQVGLVRLQDAHTVRTGSAALESNVAKGGASC